MAAKAYITAFVLFLINLLNYMDRFTVAGVLEDIQKYYILSDKEGGLLQTSFIVCYMIFAPLFGYLGDRYSRKLIMIFGILFWSVTTMIGSLIPANMTPLFFVMRALVGVGEASYSTIAPTIIADLFEPLERSKVLAFFYFAIPVGSGLGYVVGSSVASLFGSWHWALRVTPPLGIGCVILLIFLVQEPKRGAADGVDDNHNSDESTVWEDLKYIMTVRSYIWSTIGFTCVTFAVGALSWWAPNYMKYAYQVYGEEKSTQWIGFIFGIIACIGGILGVLMGVSGSQYYMKYNPRADPLVCATGVVLSVPCVFLCLVVAHKSPVWSWILVFLGITFLSTNWSIVADMLLYVIVPKRRSFSQSIQILISHLLGDASSPFVIGLASDLIKKDETSAADNYWSLQYSLYITPFVLVLGAFAFFYTAAFIEADKDRCKNLTQGQRSRNFSATSIHTLPPSGSAIIDATEENNTNDSLIDPDNKFLLYT